MSRIGAEECFCMDMEWYAVDRKGNIAVFCSAGEGNLPEFVCEDVERANELMEYFDKIKKITNSILLFKSIESAEYVAREFSDKGLYYFDANDGSKYGICTLHEYYTKLSYPQDPLKFESLPKHVKDILRYNFVEVEDFFLESEMHIKHAYE